MQSYRRESLYTAFQTRSTNSKAWLMHVTQDDSGSLADTNARRSQLEKAVPITAEAAVTAELRRAIREGVLVPGERLTQIEIANQLGVSRIPLRDALRRLEAESLVEIDGHRGARVTSLDPDDISEIYEMRILLEGLCMHHAVSKLSEEDAVQMAAAATASDDEELTPADAFNLRRDFYDHLYAHAGRPRMRRVIMMLRDNVDRYHLLGNRQHAHHAHRELATAILDRDPERASKILVEHISESRDDLIHDTRAAG